MATVVLNPDPQKFPAGATVKAYKRSNFPAIPATPSGAPVGSQDASATVASDGSVTFTGLTDNTAYVLYAASPDRYATFSTPDATSSSAVEPTIATNTGATASGVGTYADAEVASGNAAGNTVIAILKRLRTLLNGGLPAALGGNGGLKVDAAGTFTVDTELPAAAALADNLSRTSSVPLVGAASLVDDGTQLVRMKANAGSSVTALIAGLYINGSGNWQQAITGVGDNAPTYQTLMAAQGLYDPTASAFERRRKVRTFTNRADASVTSGTPAALWTPAAGKKFRIMRGQLSLSVAGQIILKDGSTEILRSPKLTAGGVWDLGAALDNGILSSLANNVLNVDTTATGNIGGWVGGTEE